jgi:hypothetical protein
MLVFILNKQGKPLMPCKPQKARKLLKEKKAKIVKKIPFTIQLLYGSSGYTQETQLGIDIGSKNIGIATTSNNNVLMKGQIELRQDIKSLLETRKILRRNRRSKLRYRKPRFLNRKRKEGWLPPSVNSKINNEINWISKFYNLLPKCELHIEIAKFDIQKIENSEITGIDYQKGTLYDYKNKLSYLISREKGKCQFCNKEYQQGNGWRMHHIWGKEKNRLEDLALLHESCHKEIHLKHQECVLRKKNVESFKDSTFMTIIRKRLFKEFHKAIFTYGYITYINRNNLNLEKEHYNDAIAITGIEKINNICKDMFYIKQFRKKKRSLHESIPRKGRNNKNTTCKRNNKNVKYCKGFYLNDKVKVFNNIGFITGFDNYFVYVKNIYNEYIKLENKKYKQINIKHCSFIQHNNNWQYLILNSSIRRKYENIC